MLAGTNANRCWFVVDAFGGTKITKDQERTSDVSYLKTFPNYGVNDKAQYQSWVQSLLNKELPRLIVPCHGAIIDNPSLPAAASIALDEMFG